MAIFCPNCGTAAVGNQKFCNKCGTQIGTPGGPACPTNAPAVPASPATRVAPPASMAKVAGAPVAAPAKQGSSAVKIIVGVVAFLALVSVLAMGSCFYISYKIKQKAMAIAESTRRNSDAPSTPELHLSEGGAGSKAAASATVDVPPYPGSTPTESGGELSAGLAGAASAQEYETSDGVDKVESFYREKFGSKISLTESGDNAVFNYLTSRGMTTVTITRDEDAGKTKINIARIGK